VLCGAGIIVGVPLVLALAVPVAVIGGSIYGSYRLHKYKSFFFFCFFECLLKMEIGGERKTSAIKEVNIK
jgi:hypothetical protein